MQAEILDLLRRCRDEFGASILLITHNLGVVADLADRVAVMYQGELIEEGSAEQVFADPQQDYTKRLLRRCRRSARVSPGRPIGPPPARRSRTPRCWSRLATSASSTRVGWDDRGSWPWTGSPSPSAPARCSAWSGRAAPARPPSAGPSPGSPPVTGGSLQVLGAEMNGVRERSFRRLRDRIGFVFQDPASSFNPLLTISDCVAEPLIVHGRFASPDAARSRVDELLEAVQLPRSYGDRYPHELSGGQRQRASLARGLALDPDLLIADEPTSALDVSVQARVLELFAELQARFGFAALFISHDLAVIDLLADRIAVLYRGQLVEEGTGAQVLGAPQHPYTQRLLASLPVPDPRVQAGRRAELHRLIAAEAGRPV